MLPTDAPRVSDATRSHNTRLGVMLAAIIAVSFGLAFMAHRILFHTVFQ